MAPTDWLGATPREEPATLYHTAQQAGSRLRAPWYGLRSRPRQENMPRQQPELLSHAGSHLIYLTWRHQELVLKRSFKNIKNPQELSIAPNPEPARANKEKVVLEPVDCVDHQNKPMKQGHEGVPPQKRQIGQPAAFCVLLGVCFEEAEVRH